jgi:hypothetical protein
MNPIDEIKATVVARVNAHPFFKNIQCISDEAGDLDTLVAKKIGELGLVVVFEMIKGTVQFEGVGAYSVQMDPKFTITEQVLLNRDEKSPAHTGKTATDALCYLLAIFNPLNPGSPSPIRVQSFNLINNTGGVITYQIDGKCAAGWKET